MSSDSSSTFSLPTIAIKLAQVSIVQSDGSHTIDAYARGVNDWLAFCHSVALTAAVAGRDTVALYVHRLHTGRQLAAATIRHRLTVVRLYCDRLCEEGMREKNPVSRGIWKSSGRGMPGIAPVKRRLPWIPDEEDWLRFLRVAGQADIRTRFMLALAYDCALRREELCHVATGDIDPARRLLTVRVENTKNRCGRVVPYSLVTGELYVAWLAERRQLSVSRGLLFLSRSPRKGQIHQGDDRCHQAFCLTQGYPLWHNLDIRAPKSFPSDPRENPLPVVTIERRHSLFRQEIREINGMVYTGGHPCICDACGFVCLLTQIDSAITAATAQHVCKPGETDSP